MAYSLYSTFGIALSSALIYVFTRAIYDIFFHPLAKVPGPLLAKVSCLWKFRAATSLKFADKLRAVHAQYGPVSLLSCVCLSIFTTILSLSSVSARPPHQEELRPSILHFTKMWSPGLVGRSQWRRIARLLRYSPFQRPDTPHTRSKEYKFNVPTADRLLYSIRIGRTHKLE